VREDAEVEDYECEYGSVRRRRKLEKAAERYGAAADTEDANDGGD
jgi:hypothetical protein